MPPRARFTYTCASCSLKQELRPASRRASSLAGPRPATAPKQYPDLKSIRLKTELYAENCRVRNYNAHIQSPKRIAELGEEARRLDAQLRQPRTWIKEASKRLAPNNPAQLDGESKAALLLEISHVREKIDELERAKQACDEEATSLGLSLPNLTSSQTPIEGIPKLIKYINFDPDSPPSFPSTANHTDIGRELSLLDFTSSTATSGWGFYYLLNEAVLLEQALVQYALSVVLRHGWRLVSPPSLVYSHIADACGFQPRDQNDEQQIWQIAQTDRDQGKPRRSLAATAEIPLAGMYANNAIPADSLPIKLVGSSRCFRAEAGARGVDTKGLYRVHEFTKVEMFAWTDSGSRPGFAGDVKSEMPSSVIFDEMVAIQSEILEGLGFPCRVLEMPSSDLGASAYRKIDIEVLFPSRTSRDGGWGEVTSASICTDYQSRRLDTRILEKNGARSTFAHTVNGTAMAVPRILAAILEHGWREEGYVVIPEVLRPFMGGQSRIGRV